MDIRCRVAVLGVFEVGVAHQIVLFVHDGFFAANNSDRITVIQPPNLVGCQQLTAGLLEVAAI